MNDAILASPIADATIEMTATVKYGLLSDVNPSYNAPLWTVLEDLYKGGFAMQQRISEHLPKHPHESPIVWEYRKKCAAYINYFGQVCDYFQAALFTQEIVVSQAADAKNPSSLGGPADGDVFSAFAKNADRAGSTLQKVLREVFTAAIKKKRAILALDFPRAEGTAANRKEEEASGVDQPYAIHLPLEHLLDWECDATGAFAWCILLEETEVRASPLVKRDTTVQTFKVWTKTVDGRAKWDLYQVAFKGGSQPNDETEVERVDSGETSFRRIPVLVLEVPDGLWVGNKIGPLSLEHFRRRTSLVAAQDKSLFAIPVAKLASEMGTAGGALPSAAAQDAGRGDDPRSQFEGRGYAVVGNEDDITFAEPRGTAYTIVDSQLKDLKDEIFRIVHQMAASVDNSSSSMRRSGASKQEDRAAEGIVLGAFGSLVRDFAVLVYTTISQARGEDTVWTPHGLTDYESEDRDSLLTEAVQMDTVDIPSPTFKKLYKTTLARRLVPNAPPETQEQIRKEIEAGVVEQHNMDTAIEKAKGAADIARSEQIVEGPPKPAVPRPGAPPGDGA